MLNMTTDSQLFRSRDELESLEGAWPTNGTTFQSGAGEWVPLYEGKMVQAFDHRASDIVLAEANVFRPGQGTDLTDEEHRDPARLPNPRHWISASSFEWDCPTNWCLSFKDVTSVTNARTTIAAMLPRYGAGHTLPVLFPEKGDQSAQYSEFAPLVLANLNSTIFDYLARQKVHGNHLAWYLLEQLPVVPSDGYSRMFGQKSAAAIIRDAVLELSYTANDMVSFARDMGHVDSNGDALPPFAWNSEQRLKLRAKLDAVFFHLYGVIDREDVKYIYSTFPIVEEKETVAYGGVYRSRELCLAYMNALAAGQPDADVAL